MCCECEAEDLRLSPALEARGGSQTVRCSPPPRPYSYSLWRQTQRKTEPRTAIAVKQIIRRRDSHLQQKQLSDIKILQQDVQICTQLNSHALNQIR
mmetsp:Transcript_19050/g.29747  ORF Transcript_19050/g.29747 Transcript_19050/m.29747 type:complete len:96 (-) Transcript_19050:1048-1335(-)